MPRLIKVPMETIEITYEALHQTFKYWYDKDLGETLFTEKEWADMSDEDKNSERANLFWDCLIYYMSTPTTNEA